MAKDLAFLRLMAITDNLRDGTDGLIARAGAAVRGGATSIQVRLKEATPREIVEVAKRMVETLGVPIIVNDRADLALAAGAAGVHVGPEDVQVRALRRVVPPSFIIGASFGLDAEFENARLADYVGIGPVSATTSKADAGDAIGIGEFKRLASRVPLPAVGVGGITPQIAAQLIAAGAAGIAVMSAIFSVSDSERASSSFVSAI
ncbi:MAG: thiamine phosphate synthase [Gemmatimonadaceae bacterium]|nr:thiamine phosphate synthase [Gemmatimonadaceae bacterium]